MKRKYVHHESMPSNYYIDGKQCEWVWCNNCKVVTLNLPCCYNTTCNCSGCEKCAPLQSEIDKLEVPKREALKTTKLYLTDNDLILTDLFDIEYFEDDE